MVIVYIFVIIWGILQIILFFKIWGMTNDVAKMLNLIEKFNECNERSLLERSMKTQSSISQTEKNVIGGTIFEEGILVVDNDDRQWRVVEIKGNVIVCKNSAKGIVEFREDELRLFGH